MTPDQLTTPNPREPPSKRAIRLWNTPLVRMQPRLLPTISATTSRSRTESNHPQDVAVPDVRIAATATAASPGVLDDSEVPQHAQTSHEHPTITEKCSVPPLRDTPGQTL